MQNDLVKYASLLELAKRQTVLVVEDDVTANRLVCGFVEKFYAVVDSAENGLEGLELFKKNRYDMVITDINMPHMDGLEMCEEIRELNAEQKIIIMTSHNDVGFMQKAIRIGVNEYMFKPIDYADFLTVLYRLSTRIESEKAMIEQNKLATMGEMISIIAHQWRQPLTIIDLVIENILMDYLTNELTEELIKKQASEAKRQISHMSKTIEDFKNFFKTDSIHEPFSILEAVRFSASLSEARLDAHDITLKVTGDDCKILGSKNQLVHVFLALIQNAIDAILEKEQNGGKITIISTIKNDDVCVSVQDNGAGAKNDALIKMFEPHFSTKAPDKGTGIGLYMVKKIIQEKLNGGVSAQNIDDGGLEVSVILPYFKGEIE